MHPRRTAIALLIPVMLLAACAAGIPRTSDRLQALLPADAILIGEQHDASDHQRLQREIIEALAGRQQLAVLVLEMAERGTSTVTLPRDASEATVRDTLRWNDKGWPWAAYGPGIMAAVHAGVPVIGGNLPRRDMAQVMRDTGFDKRLPGPALKAQQQLIRSGHCDMLPESQISPMTRVQIARDVAMSQTISDAVVPGKVVVLLAGNGHVDRTLGVPQHLPKGLTVRAIGLQAGDRDARGTSGFDAVWPTPAIPPKDYCADFKTQSGMSPAQ